jgi:hypothetical protein
MNTDKQLQGLAQAKQGHAQYTVPWTLYCIFSYHTEIQKHILINFNHSNYYQNKSDTATCNGLIVKIKSSILNIL